MINLFRDLALSYRLWLSCAVVCFGMSVLLGYHQYQVVAHQTLTEKLAMPPKVMLQNFNARAHSNMLDEARLVGEAALDRTVTLNLGADDAPNWVQIVPFFPVSVTSHTAAFQFLENSTIEEMSPETKQRLTASTSHIRSLQHAPMGMLLIEAGVSIDEAILHSFVGEGTHGPLVSVTGSIIEARAVNAQAVASFREAGTEFTTGMPLILPYPNGQRLSGPAHDNSALRTLFGWGFVAFGALSLYCAFGRDQSRPTPCAARSVSQAVEPIAPVTNVFADIRTQEELSREEASARAPATTRRILSRLT